MKYLFIFFFILSHSVIHAFNDSQGGRILFLLQQGDHDKALSLYKNYYETHQKHNFELLHQMGLNIVAYGFQQNDPEVQLLSLFGASIMANDDASFIMVENLKSSYPPIQLIALQLLANQQSDRADKALIQAMGSSHLLIRLEAVHQLCKRKHLQAVSQAESLMYKVPKEMLPIFPKFYALVGTPPATRLLRRLLNHPDEAVRIAAIQSIGACKRDDLLPQVRTCLNQLHYGEQEICAYVLGSLKDEKSKPQLKRMSQSQFPTVALAAELALYQLGDKTVIQAIEERAKNEDLFAICELGNIPESTSVLKELLYRTSLNVRVNATVALLEQKNPYCFETLRDLLIRNKYDLAFITASSPGNTMNYWKAIPSSSQIFKDDVEAYTENLEFREMILEKAQALAEKEFYQIAEAILNAQQNDLIPKLIDLLEDLGTAEAITLLKKYQQKPGAPFVRTYCALALYRLKESGPYSEILSQWVKQQQKESLIQFRPFDPWEYRETQFQLTPMETSRLLVEIFESYAQQQDDQGIEVIIESIQNGHPKNKYALAGLLIRATQ